MPDSLSPCPDSPNCVSTVADPSDKTHFVEPLLIGETSHDVVSVVESVLAKAGARITERSDTRIDAVFTSRIFRFKDDVAIVVDAQNGVLHARSASRVGHSDLGVNRKRIATLFSQISAELAS